MSTIAYRDGIIAADTLCIRSSVRTGYCTKIARRPDGTLGGAVGSLSFASAFLRWISEDTGDAPAREKDDGYYDAGLIVHPDGVIEVFEYKGYATIRAPYYAMGSGAEFAFASMSRGDSAAIAVATAIHFDIHSGGEIEILQRDKNYGMVDNANQIFNAD